MPPHPLQQVADVHIGKDYHTLLDDLGMALTSAAARAVDERGAFHLALSGGSTPERFYMNLCVDPRFRDIPWSKTHLWIVDERRVPLDDEKSNYRMMRETLVDHLPVRRRQTHPVPVDEDDPAHAYEQALCAAFDEPDHIPQLDFVLLGMGDDAHTASLFPHSPALRVHDKLIANNDGEHVTPPPRVTMTYPLLNAAREVAVLVTGEKKADALKRVADALATRPNPDELPITGIDPDDGDLTWYLDPTAAGQ